MQVYLLGIFFSQNQISELAKLQAELNRVNEALRETQKLLKQPSEMADKSTQTVEISERDVSSDDEKMVSNLLHTFVLNISDLVWSN